MHLYLYFAAKQPYPPHSFFRFADRTKRHPSPQYPRPSTILDYLENYAWDTPCLLLLIQPHQLIYRLFGNQAVGDFALDFWLASEINTYKTQYANNPEMAKRFDEPEVQREIANRLITEKTVDELVRLNKK
jgi:hypothetical protein